MRSCDRPSNSWASVFFPSSVSKVYSFSTGTQGSSCRCLASSSSRVPSSCSRSWSSLRAADHSSRVPTLCFGIAFASSLRSLSYRPSCAAKLIVLAEVDHAADAVLGFHQLEAAVDLVEAELVRDERLDVDLAGEPAIDQLRHLVAALDAAE